MDTGSYAQRMPQSQAESTVWINPKAAAFTPAPPPSGAKEFHESLPGYQPTNLISVPELAQELGVDHVFIKDESERFGLPAFKALGAAWAIDKALKAQELNQPANPNPTLVTATDGNHGRAVANTAKKLGLKARIYIPNTVSETAIDAIKSESAEVHVLDTHYDEIVTIAAQNAADSNSLLIQDTAWEGYPTMLAEVDEQLASQHEKPTHVLVPTGVGSLLQAVLTHYRSQGPTAAHVISVEPDTAAHRQHLRDRYSSVTSTPRPQGPQHQGRSLRSRSSHRNPKPRQQPASAIRPRSQQRLSSRTALHRKH